MKIVVAEDTPASRELIREVLQASGYEVVEACDGEEALEKIEQDRPGLVLLDIQMPRLDGFAVLRRLREDPRFAGLRVIALTAYAMEGDREKMLRAGFDGYITKPIDIPTLRAQLQKFENPPRKEPALE